MPTQLKILRTFRQLQGKKYRTFAECECICGQVICRRLDIVKNGNIKSCGCISISRMKDYSSIINTTINNLFVLRIFAKDSRTYAECLCICGTKSVTRLHDVVTGQTKSCGCVIYEEAYRKQSSVRALKDKPWEYNTKHGYASKKAQSQMYKIYYNILDRCCNSNCSAYENYGGRGIKVCDRWLEPSPQGFLNFLADMQERPSNTYSIDRINNDGNYEPSNCRWATKKEQANNRRTNISFRGETKSFKEWCSIFDIKPATAYQRIKAGWTFEQALTLKKWTKLDK